MVEASAYKAPHHVMLFFQEKEIANTQHAFVN